MDITTAESLGDKLGALDLTEDEATLLGQALVPAPDAEVEGFWIDILSATLLPTVRERAGKGFRWGETNRENDGYMKIEMDSAKSPIAGGDLGSGR